MTPPTFTERIKLALQAAVDAVQNKSQACLTLAEAELMRIGAEADALAAKGAAQAPEASGAA